MDAPSMSTISTEKNSGSNCGVSKESDPESSTCSMRRSTEDVTLRLKRFKPEVIDSRLITGTNSAAKLPSKLSRSDAEDQKPSVDLLVPDLSERKYHTRPFRRVKSGENGNQINNSQNHYEKLLYQVSQWLQTEKARRELRRSKRIDGNEEDLDERITSQSNTTSYNSCSSTMSLENLQKILEDNSRSFQLSQKLIRKNKLTSRTSLKLRVEQRESTKKEIEINSDTESHDWDITVPSCDIFLDNSKSVSYSPGNAESSHQNSQGLNPTAEKEKFYTIEFKAEILKLAWTLNLNVWNRLSLDCASDIEVERLSGALTNSVYVISVPSSLSEQLPSNKNHRSKPSSEKFLLRIFGSQVDHLIDRENELRILRRLARKKIGPRMLGTFKNGRIEEFLNAITLTAEDIRIPETSIQIAKRMRELHDSIKLLEREREDGPCVFRNWDKWVERCEKIMTYLDERTISEKDVKKSKEQKRLKFVCGVEWPQFKFAVEKYRQWLDDHLSKTRIKQSLVFAHNDTQYGNILRLVPENSEGTSLSTLLTPANSHKQLVVIDFEYASANTPALEFANHFTEWCYNYHRPTSPWLCDTSRYPSLEEQTRFIKSYVSHWSEFRSQRSEITEIGLTKNHDHRGTFDKYRSDGRYNLDDATISINHLEKEASYNIQIEKKVQELLEEVRLWRAVNSAQWVAWGIVQSQFPELRDSDSGHTEVTSSLSTEEMSMYEPIMGKSQQKSMLRNDVEVVEIEDRFDYLSYASDRALFFWGDLLTLGVYSKEELPTELVERAKFVDN